MTDDGDEYAWEDEVVFEAMEVVDANDEAKEGTNDAASPWTACWRCGKLVDQAREACPHCDAALQSHLASPSGRVPLAKGDDATPLVLLVIHYAAFLAVSLVYGWVVSFGFRGQRHQLPGVEPHLLVVGAIDTGLVLLALVLIRGFPAIPAPTLHRRVGVWVLAGTGLLGVIALNMGWQWAIQRVLRVQPFQAGFGLSLATLTAICVQPAIIEELLFRYLALGTLRAYVGPHACVLVSATMFGMAHIFNPLAIPYLLILGAFLGYARLYSGGLALPMILHFAHNLAVLALEN
jgi:membrane protease YdiL (CAAX protease family)